MGKFYIKTFGCQMNEYDSHQITKILERDCKLTITQEIKNADVIIMNTCSIREKAQEKVFHQLGYGKN